MSERDRRPGPAEDEMASPVRSARSVPPVRSAESAPPLVRAEALAFSWGAGSPGRVLDGLSFEVREGEVFGVVGPNGAGKSTLVGLLCGMLAPEAGRLELAGRPIAAYAKRALAQRLALVPQDTAVSLPFTVEEMVLMGRAPHLGLLSLEGPADRAVARDAMAETEVLHLAHRPVDRLSGGERQRVLIARALAQAPRLLVCDEPTAHLDIHHQVHVYDLLWRRTREAGLTVITVLHDLNLAAAYCDRVLLLDQGRAAAVGTVPEVLTYRNVKTVYGTEVWVGVNELTGARYLVPVAGHRREEAAPADTETGAAQTDPGAGAAQANPEEAAPERSGPR